MRNKLRSRRGETLTETLVAVLVVALSAAILAAMITSAARVDRAADEAMKELYEQLNAAESGAGAASSVTGNDVTVTETGKEGETVVEVSLPRRDAGVLTSYTLKKGGQAP